MPATELKWSDEDFKADEESGERVIVPPGTYDAVVSSSELGVSKNGNKKWVLEFAIKGGECSGQKLMKHVPLEGRGAGIGRQTLLAFHEQSELTGTFILEPTNYIGEKVVLEVEAGEFTNDHGTFPSADVKRVLRPAA